MRFTVVVESTRGGRELPKNRKKSRASHLDTMLPTHLLYMPRGASLPPPLRRI